MDTTSAECCASCQLRSIPGLTGRVTGPRRAIDSRRGQPAGHSRRRSERSYTNQLVRPSPESPRSVLAAALHPHLRPCVALWNLGNRWLPLVERAEIPPAEWTGHLDSPSHPSYPRWTKMESANIARCDWRPKRSRKRRPQPPLTCGRIIEIAPRKRDLSHIHIGVPDSRDAPYAFDNTRRTGSDTPDQH